MADGLEGGLFFWQALRQSSDVAAPESDQPNSTESRSGGSGRTLVVIIFFLGLYVLSPGPLSRIYKNRRPPPVLLAFYAPLEYAHNHCAPIRQFYEWYFKLWGGR